MRRPVTIPLYGLIVVLMASILSPIASVFVSVKMSDVATARALRERDAERERVERRQAVAAELARESSRKRTCDLFRVFIDPFEEEPPTRPASKAMNKKLREEYRRLQCVPPR